MLLVLQVFLKGVELMAQLSINVITKRIVVLFVKRGKKILGLLVLVWG